MGKRKWDGNFKESQYVETGNIVNDVIENDGRILHEETSDGYTHEMVDRGGYISDDYYFPQRQEGKKKPHIHYEFRSDGAILIDGKTLSAYKGGNIMGIGARARLKLDNVVIDKKAGDEVREGERLEKLGEKFEGEKAKLEGAIVRVQNSRMSDADKRKMISELELTITSLQEQYENEVAQEQEKVKKVLQEQIEFMDEGITEYEQQAESLRNIQLDVTKTDTTEAADVADQKKLEFERMKKEYTEKLRIQVEHAQMQQRNMRAKRLSER